MPIRLCAEAGCGELVYYRGRCREHASAQNRPSNYSHVYSTKRWRLLRRKVIVEHPICQSCGNAISTVGDHVLPLDSGGAPYDRENVQALCVSCHGVKTRREMQA